MGTETPPANQMAKSMSAHSYRVRDMLPTRSPAPMPLAMRPFASADTSATNSLARMSCHWPAESRRENRAGLDASAAWRSTRSVMLLSKGTFARGGTLNSRTLAPLISVAAAGSPNLSTLCGRRWEIRGYRWVTLRWRDANRQWMGHVGYVSHL